MKTISNNIKCGLIALLAVLLASCSFLENQVPQGTLSDQQVKDPAYVDNLIISAYAIFMSAEDINSSFSMWNFDVRSDDAYKGGASPQDGDVYHSLEISQGIMTTDWSISVMWQCLYNCLSRVNTAIALLDLTDESYTLKDQRMGEMKFLRAYGHFLLKRLYKNIPFVMDENLTTEAYNNLSNTAYTNDEGWQLIIDDLMVAYNNLPNTQADKGRPTKASAAAFLAKVYLYKAYHQDDKNSHAVTSINLAEMDSVIKYSEPAIYTAAGYGLEPDFHNNFRPEPQFENGVESLWAIQYSMNDGTTNGNRNWSYGLMCPNISGVTDGGCDFYKPSQNLVNAFKTDINGLPIIGKFNVEDYDMMKDYADPRLFLTVGLPGLPYEFNPKYIMAKTPSWGRAGGQYGYYVTLKHNVDPDSEFIVKGKWYGTSMNRIVLRYADVMLERAEAYAQKGDVDKAIAIVNELRARAKQSLSMISNYESDYGVHFNIGLYSGAGSKEEALDIVKMERRVELAMESERFFDLVRWGEAETVLNKYYAEETDDCAIYKDAHFTKNKHEYVPIPFEQIAASNGHYTQNIGGW